MVWFTSENPTVASNSGITSDGTGTGTFTSDLTGLNHATTYYVRAYATNSAGTAYGNQVQFSTGALPATVTTADIDDKTKNSALGGGEVTDDGGAPVTARGVVWSTTEDPTLDDNEGFTEDGEGNREIYGAIYNWIAVETGKLCPAGWLVASDDDWTELTVYLGGLDVAGGKLKETGTEHWMEPNTGATDEYGFRALPGGNRDGLDGSFKFKGNYGFWWTSTPSGLNNYYRALGYDRISVTRHVTAKMYGMSVRCIKE